MALKPQYKIIIQKFIQQQKIADIYYENLCQALNAEIDKININDLILFFVQSLKEQLNKSKVYFNTVNKYFAILIDTLNLIKENEIGISDLLIKEIKSIEEVYFSKKFNDSTTVENIKLLNVIINQLNIVKEEVPQEKNEKFEEVKDEIASLELELDKEKKKYNDLLQRIEQKDNKLKKTQEEKALFKQQLQEANKTIADLRKTIKKSNERIIELEKSLSRINDDYEKIKIERNTLKERVNKLNDKDKELKAIIERLNNTLEEQSKEYKLYVTQVESEKNALKIDEENSKKIKKLIISKLSNNALTLEELIAILNEEGFIVSKSELRNYLEDIKSYVNIGINNFGQGIPKYRVKSPAIMTNEEFNIVIPYNCRVFDILLVSDLHLENNDEEILKVFDIINEYCIKNNIKLVLNVGDFFHGSFYRNTNPYVGLEENRKLVMNAISIIPYTEGIYHAVLGGNHDTDMLSYGFDPIALLAKEREDFINLGYDHCTVTFNGHENILNNFMLHHPDNKYIDPVKEDEYSNADYLANLEKYYSFINRNRKNSYIDIVGHFHRSGLDMLGSLCTVPSLTRDRFNDGAWHLKVYFDEESKIKNMVFIPLIRNRKLEGTTEICYKKLIKE